METVGQWIGSFNGPTPGWATLSREHGTGNRAFVTVVQSAPLPASRIELELEVKGDIVRGRAINTRAFEPELRQLISAEDYIKRHPGIVYFSKEIAVDGKLTRNKLVGSWKGDGQIMGQFDLTNNINEPPRAADHPRLSWADFKGFVAALIRKKQDLFFRGQANSAWKLHTSFHRCHRYDLLQYEQQDIAELVHRVNANSTYQYDLQRPSDFGALLSLAQHHGFPTPLLDWTRSPYVAAYFAFESLPKTHADNRCSRIFAFDGDAWLRDNHQATTIADPHPVITIHQFPALNNPRFLPQQSVHFFSNVEDVEWWVGLLEQAKKKRYLTTIDISQSERDHAMRELAYMGVTAATLFPGLEGVCRALKERFFG